MAKTDILALSKKLAPLTKKVPVFDLINTIKTLNEVHKENLSVKRDIARIEAQSELLMFEMNKRYDLYYKIFAQIFEERKSAIDKSFEVIEKGMKENDKELIQMGLTSLSTVVASSPFSNLAELSKLLNGNSVIEL